MESQLSLLVITFSLFTLLHWLAKYYKPKTKLPPGPRKLPIIGNLHQVAAAGSLPHRSLQKLAKKYGPFMHLKLGEISAVVVTSPRLAKEIMKTHDLAFLNRPQLFASESLTYGSLDIAFAPYGEYWRGMRKICTLELLSMNRVRSFCSMREDETAKFIKSIKASAGSPINLSSRISSLICASVCRAAFGEESNKDHAEFVSLTKKSMAFLAGFNLADLFPSIKPLYYITGLKYKLDKLHKQLDKILEKIIMEHQQKQLIAPEGRVDVKEEDLIDVLLRVQQTGSLDIEITIRNIKAVLIQVYAAGVDTTASTIEWAMTELVRNPKVMAKAQTELREALKGKEIIHESDLEELSYLKLVIKETLRLHAPTPLLIPRECTEHTIIDGYDIPVKTRVMVNVWAIARDPENWPDAERFIPERFDGSSIDFKGNNFEFLPFGAGRRICPGYLFGLASITLPLALLLYHFNWELPSGMTPEDLDMNERLGLAMGRKEELCLIPTIYDPSLHDAVHSS